MELAGRSVVLTGVGREGQVGEAVALAFAERGARVFLVDHSEPNVRARAEALVARGLRAASLAADLTDPAAATAVADRVREATSGRVHGVVHLAGGFAASGPIADSDPAIWHRQLAMNATTAYMTARAFVPLLRNVKGSLVFFASEAVLPGAKMANLAAYVASKSAVVSLMQVIAQEERAHGVRSERGGADDDPDVGQRRRDGCGRADGHARIGGRRGALAVLRRVARGERTARAGALTRPPAPSPRLPSPRTRRSFLT